MSYKIIYNNETGQIIMSRRLTDAQAQQMCDKNANWSYMPGAVDSVGERVINLATLKVERRAAKQVNIADQIRNQRRYLLSSTDWTQLPDSPLSAEQKTAWAAYRQALRELPVEQANVNSIDQVSWPSPPA